MQFGDWNLRSEGWPGSPKFLVETDKNRNKGPYKISADDFKSENRDEAVNVVVGRVWKSLQSLPCTFLGVPPATTDDAITLVAVNTFFDAYSWLVSLQGTPLHLEKCLIV